MAFKEWCFLTEYAPSFILVSCCNCLILYRFRNITTCLLTNLCDQKWPWKVHLRSNAAADRSGSFVGDGAICPKKKFDYIVNFVDTIQYTYVTDRQQETCRRLGPHLRI